MKKVFQSLVVMVAILLTNSSFANSVNIAVFAYATTPDRYLFSFKIYEQNQTNPESLINLCTGDSSWTEFSIENEYISDEYMNEDTPGLAPGVGVMIRCKTGPWIRLTMTNLAAHKQKVDFVAEFNGLITAKTAVKLSPYASSGPK